jgi:hypothetical protein
LFCCIQRGEVFVQFGDDHDGSLQALEAFDVFVVDLPVWERGRQ